MGMPRGGRVDHALTLLLSRAALSRRDRAHLSDCIPRIKDNSQKKMPILARPPATWLQLLRRREWHPKGAVLLL